MISPDSLGFRTTDEVQFDGEWRGQERALAALELGLDVRHAGYNIYVCGLAGTNREEVLAGLLRRFTANQPVPASMKSFARFSKSAPILVLRPTPRRRGRVSSRKWRASRRKNTFLHLRRRLWRA